MAANNIKLNKLTPAEEKVIAGKDTEMPGSGEYDNFFEPGIYTCRRCDLPLYKSGDKFEAHCGWPSFDQEISGRVTRKIDDDGERTEISCVRCGAHLGHVFAGEKLTAKDTRHCVNSLSLRFIPQPKITKGLDMAVFGGGCFWCYEAIFRRLKGVINVISGYAGGNISNPSYEQVSSGQTGHAEVVKVEFDPKVISYYNLLDVFFALHDPTSLNRQGNDIGEQYRSIIFFYSDEQYKTAVKYIDNLEKTKEFPHPIVTEVKPLIAFYPAEDCHRNYYDNNKTQPYCRLVISPKIKKLEKEFAGQLKDKRD